MFESDLISFFYKKQEKSYALLKTIAPDLLDTTSSESFLLLVWPEALVVSLPMHHKYRLHCGAAHSSPPAVTLPTDLGPVKG